ncbi:MAG: di-trans,poly-cis-decaprenylcistransferase [Oscillospiraceae bacterium]|nr:di-trans,poly-cis-decaprenylcistransferase [Oscillospiraceae bacterium]
MMSSETSLPRHIGIIMDGNGRWAAKHGLPRAAGHARGADVFRTICRYCEKIGIEALTVYAFSTENWSRSKDEVDSIMNILRRYLRDAFDLEGETIRVRFIGRRDRLEKDILSLMEEIEDGSRDNTGLKLNIAVDYGGRDEIAHAAREAAKMVLEGRISPDDIDEDLIDSLTYTSCCPPLDLLLRPSGEERISNFMLWQCAYAEFVYMDTLWPDFTPELLDKAIEEFNSRNRRFGGR